VRTEPGRAATAALGHGNREELEAPSAVEDARAGQPVAELEQDRLVCLVSGDRAGAKHRLCCLWRRRRNDRGAHEPPGQRFLRRAALRDADPHALAVDRIDRRDRRRRHDHDAESSASSGGEKTTTSARAGEALVIVMSTVPAAIASATSATRSKTTISAGTPRRLATAWPISTARPRVSPEAVRTIEVGLPT